MGNYHRIADRERNFRLHSPGQHCTGELSFPDEDRQFNGQDLPPCPGCNLRPAVDKRRFGSQNLYRVACCRNDAGDTWTCPRPADTAWVANRSQASRVWRMNCLLNGAKP